MFALMAFYAMEKARRSFYTAILAGALIALALSGCGGNNSLPNRIAYRAQSAWYRHMVCVPTSYNQPQWSADGAQIYYTLYDGSTGRSDMRVMDSQGGSDHLLLANASFPKPSPDGKWLLYIDSSASTSAPYSLLNLATMETRSAGDLGPAPVWSPDSQSIVFTRPATNEPISLLDVASGTETAIIQPLPGVAYGDSFPLPSPLGDRVAFLSDRGGPIEIYVVDMDGKNLSRVAGQSDQACGVQGGSSGNTLMGWSPDGTQLAYTHSCGITTTLDILSLKDKRVLWSYSSNYVYPAAWSPEPGAAGDGQRIMLLSQSHTTPLALIVANADGSDVKTVGTNINEPVWSPDGQRIAYTTWNQQSGLIDIFTMAWDGSDVRQLTNNPGVGVICPH